ncbi:osmoprotectant transport system permease protein [Symbiobacterium terraclitae]|jgi:osmoprotectant transport system permease protein|uniref:Osmoprotectant transport system permease protein n=1 Tax=Symbiobacterium terraclitae TaxID=557451 RepID=A0ABS4JR16_9FIRM|nr:ABC transporter permease [Symbiobacterium terraclitae]MBP2017969.1 osmoprotectant transport system permease protein [Symbiobacterium terraclitae]
MELLQELMQYVGTQWPRLLVLTGQHLKLALLAVFYGVLAGVPLGYLITRYRRLAEPVLWVANALQTVPALALIGFVMIFLGLTPATGITVLFLYTLMPIIRSTYTAIINIDPALIESATGMGMTRWQILRIVQLPLALSVALVGVRLAMVIAIGTASIMSLAGAGGLGSEIFAGIDRVQDKMILAGALPAALLAILADLGMSALERRLTPRGLRQA